METRVLRYFLITARELNISKAAETLHISQPTLSRQLMALEEELGTQLLIRGKRQISLTKEGLFLMKRADEILTLIENTKNELISSDKEISGTIEIGCGESESMRLIANTMKNLKNNYPDIKYNIHSKNTQDVREMLDKGLLDFGVLLMPVDLEKYNYLQLPHSDLWGILMPEDSALASKESIRPQDLMDIPLIVPKKSLIQNEISGWLRNNYTNLNIISHYNLLYNASLMVEEGMGYALCLDKIIRTTGGPLCFRPLEPALKVDTVVVWKKCQTFSRAAEKFLQQLQELKDLPEI